MPSVPASLDVSAEKLSLTVVFLVIFWSLKDVAPIFQSIARSQTTPTSSSQSCLAFSHPSLYTGWLPSSPNFKDKQEKLHFLIPGRAFSFFSPPILVLGFHGPENLRRQSYWRLEHANISKSTDCQKKSCQQTFKEYVRSLDFWTTLGHPEYLGLFGPISAVLSQCGPLLAHFAKKSGLPT